MPLSTAVVTRVELAGMGERVCVDLCSLLKPGEGMLVSHAFSADQGVTTPFLHLGFVCGGGDGGAAALLEAS